LLVELELNISISETDQSTIVLGNCTIGWVINMLTNKGITWIRVHNIWACLSISRIALKSGCYELLSK
jgi:hypothetical protein